MIQTECLPSIELPTIYAPPRSVVVVEAGHVYTSEVPNHAHAFSATIGADVCAILEKQGHTPEKWLFIDNYNPPLQGKPDVLDEQVYLGLLEQCGFAPDIIVHEADLVPKAKETLEFLVGNGLTKTKDGKISLTCGKHGLIVLQNSDGRLSCALLDACLYLEKANAGALSVTVLDKPYSSQQEKTFRVLNALGYNTSLIIPVYITQPLKAHVKGDV